MNPRRIARIEVFLLVGASLLIGFSHGVSSEVEDGSELYPWPMYRSGPRCQGCSPVNGSANAGGVNWTWGRNLQLNSEMPMFIAVGKNNTIFFLSSEPPGLTAVNRLGRLVWRFQIDKDFYYHTSPTLDQNGSIYFCIERVLYAVSEDGALIWNVSLPDRFLSNPVLGPDGTIYIGAEEKRTELSRGSLYAFYPNGTLKWQQGNYSTRVPTPAIGDDGSLFFVCADNDWRLNALAPNGTRLWSYEIQSAYEQTPAIGDDGTVYCYDTCDNIYAITPEGMLKWKYPIPHGIIDEYEAWSMVLAPAIGPDGTIYSGSMKGLYALESDGTLKWRILRDYEVSGVSVCSDGTLFIKSGGVVAVDAEGNVLWKHKERWAIVTELSIGSDGTVFYYEQNMIVALNGPQESDVSMIDDEREGDFPLWIFTLFFALICFLVGTILSFLDKMKKEDA